MNAGTPAKVIPIGAGRRAIAPITQPRSGSDRARAYAEQARAAATERHYRGDWERWARWCASRAIAADAADAAALADYAAMLADRGLAPATVTRAIAGIRDGFKARGLPVPDTPADVLRGIRRTSERTPAKARPITVDILRAILAAFPAGADRGLADHRDRAILALGWQAALRRAELAALDWRDWRTEGIGAALTLRRSKGERTGKAVEIAIVRARGADICPVRAMLAWSRRVEARDAQAHAGPIFRAVRADRPGRRISDRDVGRILERRMLAAGIDPAGYSAHSLRAGFLTEAAGAGVPTYRILSHSRHRQSASLDGYIRLAQAHADHPALAIGA